ncbi:MAG: metallophosphoesterase [Treponema sp.]|jgi:predicted MPP superfamily phosphohydrolase|nr:metallophosphoesterase [Treponema sp.]
MTKCFWHKTGRAPDAGAHDPASGAKRRALPFPTLFIIISIVNFLSCATASNMFILQPYTLKSPNIEQGSPITLAVIADLHNTVYGEGQEPLINAIQELAPDLILLAGDLMDEKTEPFGTELLLAGLRGVAPLYYVTGNHEYMTKRIGVMRDILSSYNVIILSDTYVVLTVRGTEILLAGIEDPAKKKYEDKTYNQTRVMERTFSALDAVYPAAYKILIAHRPERIKQYKQFPFDLIVSGHAHGGQWRIPHIAENGLYAPNQGFFPKYAGGLYEHGTLTHIVSRGLSLTHPAWIARINNPPELVVIHLEGTP